MIIRLEDYPLSELEAGLTVRDPASGNPMWMPTISVRIRLLYEPSLLAEVTRAIAQALRPYWTWLSKDFRWQTGTNAGRWLKVRKSGEFAALDDAPLSGWDQVFGGGDDKAQASPVKCKVSTWTSPMDGGVGVLKLTLPIAWLLSHESDFLGWLFDLCDTLPIAYGWAGLGAACERDYPSRWSRCEFFVLQHYYGLDPSDQAQISGMNQSEGQGHSPQWITMLGPSALGRLGGRDPLVRQLTAAGFAVEAREKAVMIRAARWPESGFHQLPPMYCKLNDLLMANRADDYFVSHSFEHFGTLAFPDSSASGGAHWLKRFDPAAQERWPGKLLAERSITVGAFTRGSVPIWCDGATQPI